MMGGKPTTDPTASILKWVAGIVAAVIGTLMVIVLVSTARAVVSHGDRLTRVETSNEARDASLARIEAAILALGKKVDGLK